MTEHATSQPAAGGGAAPRHPPAGPPPPASAPAESGATARRLFFAQALAAASGVLLAASALLLLIDGARSRQADPLNAASLLSALEQARLAAPDDAGARAAAEQARAMDVLARRAFFSSLTFRRVGGFVALASAVAFLVGLRIAALLRPRVRPPEAPAAPAMPEGRMDRLAFGVVGALALAAALWLSANFRAERARLADAEAAMAEASAAAPETPAPRAAPRPVPPAATPAPAAPFDPVAGDYADDAEMAANWPSFRGFLGLGHAPAAEPPAGWNAAEGRGLLWKVAVPRPGFSSPIVWKDRLFLTGADAETREIFCFLAKDGSLAWRHAADGIEGSPAESPEVTEDTGHAAPTPCTDGRRVYAIFANGDLVACDLEGRRVWARNLGVPENHYGHSSSLLTWRGLLIVPFVHAGGGELLALRSATGEVAWSVPFEDRLTWTSPILAGPPDRRRLVLFCPPGLSAYDPATGETVWTAGDLSGEFGASPAFDDGLVFGGNEYADLLAVDLETGETRWTWDEDLPDASSPLAAGGLLYLCTGTGVAVCLDAKTGAKLWRQEFDDGFYASPVLAGSRVIAIDRSGQAHVFPAGRTYAAEPGGALGETCVATPAPVGRRLYVRGEKHLFAFGDAGD